MIIKDIQEGSILTLDRLKAYANIMDSMHDDELRTVLRSAAMRVAQYADVALLECTIQDIAIGDKLQLWMPPVVSFTVMDYELTDITDRCTLVGNILRVPYMGVKNVTYTVKPEEDTVQQYAPLVWQMAVAMFDGNTDEEQKVYRRIPSGYVVH